MRVADTGNSRVANWHFKMPNKSNLAFLNLKSLRGENFGLAVWQLLALFSEFGIRIFSLAVTLKIFDINCATAQRSVAEGINGFVLFIDPCVRPFMRPCVRPEILFRQSSQCAAVTPAL